MDLRSAFGLHTTPFTREIRTEDHLALPMHQEALDGLARAIEGRMSAALIAPAGTGKTALLRRLVARLPEARYQVRAVKVTDLSKRDLCREIAVACDVQPAGSYPTLVRRLEERFESTLDNEAVRPVVILDEAHELRPDVLTMLRLLTNFHMDSRLVLSLVLSGQPPLGKMLRRDDQEAIARRLVFYATLSHAQRRGDAWLRRAPLHYRRRLVLALRPCRRRRRLRDEPRQPARHRSPRPRGAQRRCARQGVHRLRQPRRRRAQGALAMSTLDAEAAELPVARAADLEIASAEHRWLVRQIWTQQAVGIIGGVPKSCKSCLGLDLAVSVASATPCLGRFAVDDPGTSIVYLAEDALPLVRGRIDGLCAHRRLSIDSLDLLVITTPSLRLDLAADQARLRARSRAPQAQAARARSAREASPPR